MGVKDECGDEFDVVDHVKFLEKLISMIMWGQSLVESPGYIMNEMDEGGNGGVVGLIDMMGMHRGSQFRTGCSRRSITLTERQRSDMEL